MDDLELCLYDLEILQNHLLCAFVANLKIDAIYALYPESFCYKNLAIRKVFAFCDSAGDSGDPGGPGGLIFYICLDVETTYVCCPTSEVIYHRESRKC